MVRATKQFLRDSLLVSLVVAFGAAMGVQTALAQDADDMGVFEGKFVGCQERIDLIDYYEAEFNDNRTETGRLISSGKCITLAGRTYIPLRTGFVFSAVQMKIKGEQAVIWARTQALIASPPPARESHFNF